MWWLHQKKESPNRCLEILSGYEGVAYDRYVICSFIGIQGQEHSYRITCTMYKQFAIQPTVLNIVCWEWNGSRSTFNQYSIFLNSTFSTTLEMASATVKYVVVEFEKEVGGQTTLEVVPEVWRTRRARWLVPSGQWGGQILIQLGCWTSYLGPQERTGQAREPWTWVDQEKSFSA